MGNQPDVWDPRTGKKISHDEYNKQYNKKKDNWMSDFDSTDKGVGRTGVKGFFEGVDPLTWIGGGKRSVGQQFLGGSVGSEDFLGNISWEETPDDRDVYSQMDERQWTELKGLSAVAQRNWIRTRANELKTGTGKPRGVFQSHRNLGDAQDPEADPAAAEQANNEAAYQKWRKDTMMRLDAFSKEMGMPVEELIKKGDLGVMNADKAATSAAGSASYGAGLGGGGVSSMNTQRAVTDAQAKYQLQRAGLGMQATTSLLGSMGQMAHENEDIRRYEQGMNLQMQNANEQLRQRQYAEGKGQQTALFGLAGGVVGGMYGGPAGAAMGSQLGSGLGGMTYKQYTPQGFTYPKGSSATGSGGLGGKNPYGGSQ
jgi:hypothetical protein